MTAVVCHAPEGLSRREDRAPARRAARAGDPHRRLRHLRERLQMLVGREDVLGREAVGKAPVMPGHEFFGHVEELGEGAAEHFGVAIGDRVIAEQIVRATSAATARRASTGCARCTTSSASSARSPTAAWRSTCAFPPTARVHAIPAEHVARGCRDHRAARLRDPRGQPRRHPARRRRRDRRRGPDRADDGAGRAPQDAAQARRDRPRCRSASRSRSATARTS